MVKVKSRLLISALLLLLLLFEKVSGLRLKADALFFPRRNSLLGEAVESKGEEGEF